MGILSRCGKFSALGAKPSLNHGDREAPNGFEVPTPPCKPSGGGSGTAPAGDVLTTIIGAIKEQGCL